MTADQKRWLDANKPYRPLGQRAGFMRYVRIGTLHANGEFELHRRDTRPRVTVGCFQVGILENVIPYGAIRQ